MAITINNLIGGSINIITNAEPEKYMGPLCFTAQEDNATVGMTGSGDYIKKIFSNFKG